MTFTDGTTQTVTHALTLTGTANAPVVINDIGGGTTPKLTLNPGAAQDINNVNVTNNDASGGVELVAGGTSTLSGITTNWLLGANGATVVWTGTSSTDWNDPTNWNLGIVPSSIDTVVIPQGAPHQPVSPSSEATGNVALNGTLDAGSSSVTVNGNITGGSDGTITGADPSFNVDGYIGTIDDPVNTAVSGTISWNALGMQDLLSISLAGTGNYAFGTAIPGFVFINGILDNNAGQGAFRNSLTGGESPLTHLNPSIPAPLNSFHKEKLILFLPGSLPGVSAGRIVEF